MSIGSLIKSYSPAIIVLWLVTSGILFFVWFGSTLDISDRYDGIEEIKNAKRSAKGFGITFLIPLAVFLLYLFIKKMD